MPLSEISPENIEYYKLFEQCNHSELYQIARRAGHNVPPNLSREALIKVIIYEEQPTAAYHDIDEWRRAVMRFLIDHKRILETQITCPAKSFLEDACFGCVDAQVLTCLTSNPENLHLIQLRKKKP
jgi:hypothetical protein